jgi:hypothetical protein
MRSPVRSLPSPRWSHHKKAECDQEVAGFATESRGGVTMTSAGHKALNTMFFVLLAMCATHSATTKAQESSLPQRSIDHSRGGAARSTCNEADRQSPAKDALRLVCPRTDTAIDEVAVRGTIVIGFVGGFVRRDDPRRPEVQFAALLRERYPSARRVEVFANHDGKKALRQILWLLDVNDDGILTATEKEQARIIIYGHSWGGAQAVTLARQLGRQGIRVLLTVQVDSVTKFWQSDSRIPANVARVINFYQAEGWLHGRSTIRAVDSDQTKILGNFRMTYEGHDINCEKIDSELSGETSAAQSSWVSGSLFTK